MPLEASTYLEGLRDDYPLSGDPVNQGDDHLTLIKRVLKATFPGIDGNGFKKAITTTEDELNFSSGLTGNIQVQLDALTTRIDGVEASLPAPSGTRMLFAQASVPTGWSPYITDTDDKYIRINDAGGGGFGGSFDWMDAINLSFTVDGHALSIPEMPAHAHDLKSSVVGNNYSDEGYPHFLNSGAAGVAGFIESEGGGATHTHGLTDASTSAVAFRPTYFDVIVGEKD